MSANELRQAAETLRERVAALDEMRGHWDAIGSSVYGERFKCHEADCSVNHRTHVMYDDEEVLTAYVATLDPEVAEALADWLDKAGADWFAFGDEDHHRPEHEACAYCDDDPYGPHLRSALTIARLVNGAAS